jgi:hypothetical protein
MKDLSDIQAENREIERVLSEARLAECERERDWAQLLARAVLGCSISTYEVCDQTIGIFSRTKMLWADWDGIGETDAKSSLPKETPELRAAIEAAIKVPEGVEDAQGLRMQLTKAEDEVRELRAERDRLRDALKQAAPMVKALARPSARVAFTVQSAATSYPNATGHEFFHQAGDVLAKIDAALAERTP